jgi:hypothetical protein
VGPMPGWLALALLCVGTALILYGVYCGAKAYVIAWRTYGSGEMWPWLAALIAPSRFVLV